MKQRIYIETTIPSFYHEVRNTPDMVARRDWTVEWWQNRRHEYLPVTSAAVIDELERGIHPKKGLCVELISNLAIVTVEKEIYEIVDYYIGQKLMPDDPHGDAIHLALASFHNCQFLLTWNCAHLANANKFEHIRHVNTILGLSVPIITTPVELLFSEEE